MRIPMTKQGLPGKENAMPGPKPTRDQLPSTGGRCRKHKTAPPRTSYEAKRAIITGGDSGHRRCSLPGKGDRVCDLRIPPRTMETDGSAGDARMTG
ncbi:hypothetical protein NHJ13734_008804 [Beauveria thailandica]